MSEAKLKKLREATVSATALLGAAVIGEQLGNHSQEAVKIFNAAIESSVSVLEDDAASAKDIDTSLAALKVAGEAFEDAKTSEPAISMTKVVQLIGTDSQRTGFHSLHFSSLVINFKDGAAELSNELADKLIAEGYAE
ncbi:hypothetical protein BBD42_30900 [Paenibacillus sp. BIHB 4019]|uniref:Uncharacterized protein n=1 Tax=Paenibacillus sp. BIHB 4019 TaxID=1870819 RepID=A0A1B2DRT0_9BACL|nr:hypothetical protein [Paenibacillus sp. BIHB 4019]ANY70416.1 hypothetical protein BBD42_30900 [Paenibacillus sp. BIHB 4019]